MSSSRHAEQGKAKVTYVLARLACGWKWLKDNKTGVTSVIIACVFLRLVGDGGEHL